MLICKCCINRYGTYQFLCYFSCDVTKREEVMETAKKVQNEVGNVTILINNAGIMPHSSFMSLTADDFQRTIDINLMGNFWVTFFYQKKKFSVLIQFCFFL